MAPDESEATSLRFDRLHAFRHFARFTGRTQSQDHIRLYTSTSLTVWF